MKINKVVLFDVDGVIIRLPEYFSNILEKRGYINAANILTEYYKGPENILCLEGKADPERSITPFLERIGWEYGSKEYFRQQFDFEKAFVDRVLLTKIKKSSEKGITCILATDQDVVRAKYLLNELNFKNYFEDHYISCETGCRKREMSFWETVITDISFKYPETDVSNVLFCDDVLENINKAKSAGLNVLHVRNRNDINTIYGILDSIR